MNTQQFRKLSRDYDREMSRSIHDDLVRKESLRMKRVDASIMGMGDMMMERKRSRGPKPDFKFPLINHRYKELCALFGSPTAQGEDFAMWDNPSFSDGYMNGVFYGDVANSLDGIFDVIYLTGEMYNHYDHIDFMFSQSRLQVMYNNEKARHIGELSKALKVDTGKDEIEVACHFIGGNLAGLWIGAKVGMGLYDNMMEARQEYKALLKSLYKEF